MSIMNSKEKKARDRGRKQGYEAAKQEISNMILGLNIPQVLKSRDYPCGETNCEPVRLVLDEILSKLN